MQRGIITSKTSGEEKIFPNFSAKERDWRWNRVREGMRREGIDCLVIIGSCARWNEINGNIRYLSNFGDKLSTTNYLVFPLEGDPLLLLQMSIKPSTHALCWIEDIKAHASSQYGKLIVEKIKELKLEKGFIGLVNIDNHTMIPHNIYNIIVSELPNACIGDKTDFYTEFQMVHSNEAIMFLRKAAELGNLGFKAGLKAIKPGAKEYEVHAAIEYTMASNGGESPMLILMNSGSMSEEYSMEVDPYPSGRVLKSGDIVLAEISSKYAGYYAQSQHTVTLGEPLNEIKELAKVVLEMYEKVSDLLRPGITSEDIKKGCNLIFKKYGYINTSPLKLNGAGFYAGGYGEPYSSRVRNGKVVNIEENMAFLVKITHSTTDQSKGVYLGNTFIITKNGHECIHGKPPQLITV